MIRLLIADDHPIVREGLKRIVADCPDMRVVAEAADADEARTKSETADVDVLLLDITMPGPGFLETVRHLRTKRPRLRVLVLSVHPEHHYAVRALRAGAAGYLTKHDTPKELVDAIRRVYKGHKYITESLAEKLALDLGPDTIQPPHEALSDREYQVFRLLGSGKSVGSIAAELVLSPKTVSTYRTRILEKIHFINNTELIRYALEKELAD